MYCNTPFVSLSYVGTHGKRRRKSLQVNFPTNRSCNGKRKKIYLLLLRIRVDSRSSVGTDGKRRRKSLQVNFPN